MIFAELPVSFVNAIQNHLNHCKKCKGKGTVAKWVTPGGFYSDAETVECPNCGRLRREWTKIKQGETDAASSPTPTPKPKRTLWE